MTPQELKKFYELSRKNQILLVMGLAILLIGSLLVTSSFLFSSIGIFIIIVPLVILLFIVYYGLKLMKEWKQFQKETGAPNVGTLQILKDGFKIFLGKKKI